MMYNIEKQKQIYNMKKWKNILNIECASMDLWYNNYCMNTCQCYSRCKYISELDKK